ncbi:conserved hypothetical protein [Chlamydia pneumoniae LPCoLN]|uniref:Uncharacterized protein n=1 Tax=Chlamydia pneumoniae TaxID=83558 RepID=Q9K1V2_CHLPN|nr:hypothetical protein CP_0929 [Chlamydia pneumoniae AR39]ACZ32824.1 conserved hypothetical protein [Chlamydia pneumoniae LPCoLN]CRI33466.1 Uncharacterized protein BN1224_Wien1_A_09730 [Chlamydia pneumoniae]CRI36329.1 Uncharacterized protein BN1224_CM1_A_09760 [Chlamydia pneumoniae]CRI37455.1 Uncharacterized protein BN1224_CV14_A_09740 [Chlamydia pneumoniae]
MPREHLSSDSCCIVFFLLKRNKKHYLKTLNFATKKSLASIA